MSGTQIIVVLCLTLLGIWVSCVPAYVFAWQYYKESKAVKVYVVLHIIAIILLLGYLTSLNPIEIRQGLQ